MDICVRVADSLHCIVETNTMVYSNYAPSKKKNFLYISPLQLKFLDISAVYEKRKGESLSRSVVSDSLRPRGL